MRLEKEKNMPKISALMPIYNTDQNCLKETIDSILAQTMTDFELLVLNDSPENTEIERIVLSYKDKRIKYFKNEKNLGISQTRNKLLQLSNGEYLAVIDHDDISAPSRFEKEAYLLDKNPEIGVVGSWYRRLPDGKIKKRYLSNEQIRKDLTARCAILHPSSMIRKSILEENNIAYEEAFSPAEDWALWVRLIGKTKFANIPEILLSYRDYVGNTSKAQKQKMEQASLKVRELLLKTQPDLVQKSCFHQKISLLGFPLFQKSQNGCTINLSFFKIIKLKYMEKIK